MSEIKNRILNPVEEFSGYESWQPEGQLLVMMLGVPGSGKSYFARQLAEILGFKRFSSDAIRTELFGRPDPQPVKRYSGPMFEVLNERVENALIGGHSVIRDHMHHRCHWRELGRQQAGLVGAMPIMVWVKTPYELAHKRGLERELTADQRVETCSEKMQESISHHHNALDLPAEGEICLEIDGQLSFSNQLCHFVDFCSQYENAKSVED